MAEAEALADRAATWLITQQDDETGGWSHNPDGPNLPAITALVVRGLLMDPEATPDDPAIRRGLDYILSFRKDDGGIHDNLLATYNTAICMSALAIASDKGFDDAHEVIETATPFLKGLQWGEGAIEGRPDTGVVEPQHAFYGGWGYGRSGRPDLSNTSIALEALHDVGVPGDDPAFQRALSFLQRTQMLEQAGAEIINDMPYAEGSTQGGFIYSTSPDRERVGKGESKAGMITESLSDGSSGSRLRSYGSMTYAGFKSMIYADLTHGCSRLRAAYQWLLDHFTLDENPGIGLDGYYYYLMTASRALNAVSTIDSSYSGHQPLRVGMEPWFFEGYVNSTHGQGMSTDDAEEHVIRIRMHRESVPRNVTPESGHELIVVTRQSPRSAGRAYGKLEDGSIVVWCPRCQNHSPVSVYRRVPWADSLITKLMALQTDSGAFPSLDDRWMEDNPTLITAYSLLAARHAIPYLTSARGAGEHTVPVE
ncbi:MAG: prenyltransferase/squalene oxidase repeat-containing protein [Planctomycetota bacterium]